MLKRNWAMVTITTVFLAAQAAVVLALAHKGQADYIRSVMATTGFWVAYSFLEARYSLYMNAYVRVLMVLTIFADAFFGYYFDLYATSFVFDKLLHVFGAYSVSLFAYILVAQFQPGPLARPVKFILVAALGLSMGGLYEILEFFTDSISRPYPPSQPSLLDTDVDLIGDLAGALVAAGHASWRNFADRIG